MSGDTGRKGGEGSIFGSAIADFAMVCTKAAMDGAGSRISPDAQAERQVVMQTLLLWCRAADNRAISISVLAKPTKALWAMSLDPAGARQLGEFDAIACFVHTIATYIDGGLTSEEPLDGSPRFIENMVGCLCNLACVDGLRFEFVELRVVPLLLKLCTLHHNSDSMIKAATSAMWVLLLDPENMAQFIGSHGVDMLIKICSVKQKADTMQACAGIFRVIAMGNSSDRATLVKAGGIDAMFRMLQDHVDAKASTGKVAPDVFMQLLGAITCIAEDVMISPGSFTKSWLQLIVRFVMPLPPQTGKADTTNSRSSRSPKKGSPSKAAKQRYFSEDVIAAASVAYSAMVMFTPTLLDDTVSVGLLGHLIRQMSINNRPRTIAAVLRACEVLITDHEQAMAEFLQKGGLEVALEVISRPDLDDSLLEGLELLQCVAAATPDIVQRAKSQHYDLEGMVRHRAAHQKDQVQQAVQQLLVTILKTDITTRMSLPKLTA